MDIEPAAYGLSTNLSVSHFSECTSLILSCPLSGGDHHFPIILRVFHILIRVFNLRHRVLELISSSSFVAVVLGRFIVFARLRGVMGSSSIP